MGEEGGAGWVREGFLEEGVSKSSPEGWMGVSEAEMGANFRGGEHTSSNSERMWEVPSATVCGRGDGGQRQGDG